MRQMVQVVVDPEEFTGARHEVVALAKSRERPVEEASASIEPPTTSRAKREAEQDVGTAQGGQPRNACTEWLGFLHSMAQNEQVIVVHFHLLGNRDANERDEDEPYGPVLTIDTPLLSNRQARATIVAVCHSK